ncbi:hypothetical protein CASFOL_000249 [Castilleja foliolosa]|uniref:F-box domain-containing protein n=1 Tax=Castilleja foliolosa TaxID=1961234 RepID=A0ABD3EN57_9LAMI
MELEPNHIKSLSQDLILDILSRLDGPTLAATAATCIDLRDAAEDEKLWQKLCHDTWPSTSKRQLSLEKTGGFKSLYSDAFPLILQHEVKSAVLRKTIASFDTSLSSMDFISFIDIYYKGQCIFSKVMDSIIEGVVDLQGFVCYPLHLDVSTNLPLTTFLDCDETKDISSNKIVGDVRLSWILFDRTNGKAVNISSWTPRSIEKGISSEDGYLICFGSVVTTENGITTHVLAEFAITVQCKLLIKQGCIIWTEITLAIKDIDGSHLNGERSVRVMKQALSCTRSVNHYMVKSRYQQFCEHKTKLKLMKEQQELLANLVCATIAIATLLGICYVCAAVL